MKSKQSTQEKGSKLGMNKTGAAMAPHLSEEMKEGTPELTTPRMPAGSSEAISENRMRFRAESEPLGSVPIPLSLKGVASTLTTPGASVLIDKLGERMAFERTGTRLYDALISKRESAGDRPGLPSLEALTQIREEEHQHFLLIAHVIRQMGGDPTAVTPAANIASINSMGLLQVVTDPRTTFSQCLESILTAELVDNVCWETLIALAEKAGLPEVVNEFRRALDEEELHLRQVRQWIEQDFLITPEHGQKKIA